MRYYLLLALIVLFSCKGKGKQQPEQVTENTTEQVLSEVEEVTAAVSALLTLPNSFKLVE